MALLIVTNESLPVSVWCQHLAMPGQTQGTQIVYNLLLVPDKPCLATEACHCLATAAQIHAKTLIQKHSGWPRGGGFEGTPAGHLEPKWPQVLVLLEFLIQPGTPPTLLFLLPTQFKF